MDIQFQIHLPGKKETDEHPCENRTHILLHPARNGKMSHLLTMSGFNLKQQLISESINDIYMIT